MAAENSNQASPTLSNLPPRDPTNSEEYHAHALTPPAMALPLKLEVELYVAQTELKRWQRTFFAPNREPCLHWTKEVISSQNRWVTTEEELQEYFDRFMVLRHRIESLRSETMLGCMDPNAIGDDKMMPLF